MKEKTILDIYDAPNYRNIMDSFITYILRHLKHMRRLRSTKHYKNNLKLDFGYGQYVWRNSYHGI
jgi:hypothetical protein